MSDTNLSDQHQLTLALGAYLSEQSGRHVEVTGLTRLSGGWESDVFGFEAPGWLPGGHVLRLYFGSSAAEKAHFEYQALELLASAGYPVPHVDLVEGSEQALGRSFLIMERIQGVSLGNLWRNPDPAVRQREIERFCALHVELHTLAWRDLPGASVVPVYSIAGQLELWRGYLAPFSQKAPAQALAWLSAANEKVQAAPPGLVHWDFHHENILVDEQDRAWVIDWTQLQATDTRFDLAWTLILLASERDAETAQAVRGEYFRQRGWDEEEIAPELDYFEAAACAKRLLSILIAMANGADALGMRPGSEAIMHSRLSRFAIVYHRWLELTGTPLVEVEEMLAGVL